MLNWRLRTLKSPSAMILLRMILLVACCAVVLQTQTGYGTTIELPGIDCAKPKGPLDSEICADKAMKEWWVGVLTRDALTLNPGRRDAINAKQQEWITLRGLCADPDGTMACSYALYDEHIAAVVDESIQPLWRQSAATPGETLAALKPLSSPLAKLYADLLTHATADESIAAFLTFADNLRFDGAVWKNGPAVALPCTLVEKYPRLLLVTRPGSGRLSHDCDWEPEPAPVRDFLKNNLRALENWFERCHGGGRAYHAWAVYSFVVGDRMRYFPRSYVTDRLASIDAPDKPWPMPQAVEAWYADPDYRKAQIALSDYYRVDFRLSQEEAETAATRALWDGRNTMVNPAACLD